MAAALGFFLLGLFLLALGGDSIVKGASGLGRRLGRGCEHWRRTLAHVAQVRERA